MTSYELAKLLREKADELDNGPVFEPPGYLATQLDSFTYFYSKNEFLKAVQAVGAGKKDVSDPQYFAFRPKAFPTIVLKIERDLVCKLVRPAEYDCGEALLAELNEKVTDSEGIPF
jgi:hypothetical protein